LTGANIERYYIQAQGKIDKLGESLVAAICEFNGIKIHVAMTKADEKDRMTPSENEFVVEARKSFLSQQTPSRAMITGGVCHKLCHCF
jgi:putative DNA methylase